MQTQVDSFSSNQLAKTMGFSLYDLLLSGTFAVNAVAVLHEKRFLAKRMISNIVTNIK